MKPYPECSLCMLKWIYERITNSLDDEQKFHVAKKLLQVFARELDPAIDLGILCNRALGPLHEFVLGSSGPYEQLKRKSNEAAGVLLREAKAFIERGDTPRERLERACGLAAVGNVAPIGVPSGPFDFSMVRDIIKGESPLPRPEGDVYDAAFKSKNIFYVADNAGEIGFDSLLISLVKNMGSNVALLVKQGPFFDDATLEDVHYFGLEQTADVVCHIKEGFFVPGARDGEMASLFEKSDLVISKGTGNFEALKGNTGGRGAIFLLKAKCAPVAEETGTPLGEFAVRLEPT